MSQRSLDIGLADLKQRLLSMAGLVETAINNSIDVWRLRNIDRIQEVYTIEQRVNECHMEIDKECFTILATQQPLASDLRFILGAIKINNEMERMVDQAVNIANNAEYYLKNMPILQLNDLSQMADQVNWMVRHAIDAFVQSEEKLATEVCLRDDAVDDLKNKIFLDIIAKIKTDVNLLEQGLNLILIARNLERIGDHATNIAEDVVFTVSGKDIRHANNQMSSGGGGQG